MALEHLRSPERTGVYLLHGPQPHSGADSRSEGDKRDGAAIRRHGELWGGNRCAAVRANTIRSGGFTDRRTSSPVGAIGRPPHVANASAISSSVVAANHAVRSFRAPRGRACRSTSAA